MSKRKTFVEGQAVQVAVRTAAGTVWRSAIYARPAATPGVHWCRRGALQLEYSTRNVRAVPIKAREVAPPGQRGHASWCMSVKGDTGACDCDGDAEDDKS